jgi:cytoskeletal protein CcmA (bactofilin family)
MFRRKKSMDDLPSSGSNPLEDLSLPVKPATRPAPAAGPNRPPVMPPRQPADPPRPAELPRRLEPVPPPSAAAPAAPPQRQEAEMRKLIVGREISLAGEITSCDRLVVEGSVEANLANCRDVEISESGVYKGSASIEDAEIRGRFEGVLHVRKRLLIKATGRVIGTVRYGQLEIECGGQISGDIQAQPTNEGPGATMESSQPIVVQAVQQELVR